MVELEKSSMVALAAHDVDRESARLSSVSVATQCQSEAITHLLTQVKRRKSCFSN